MIHFSITLNRVNILFFLVCLLLMIQDHHYQHQAYVRLECTDTLWTSLNVQMLVNICSCNKWLKTRAFFSFYGEKWWLHLPLLYSVCSCAIICYFLQNVTSWINMPSFIIYRLKLVKHTTEVVSIVQTWTVNRGLESVPLSKVHNFQCMDYFH